MSRWFKGAIAVTMTLLRYAKFYDWNNEFGSDSYDASEAVANHLKLEEYYRLWERHLGNELHF